MSSEFLFPGDRVCVSISGDGDGGGDEQHTFGVGSYKGDSFHFWQITSATGQEYKYSPYYSEGHPSLSYRLVSRPVVPWIDGTKFVATFDPRWGFHPAIDVSRPSVLTRGQGFNCWQVEGIQGEYGEPVEVPIGHVSSGKILAFTPEYAAHLLEIAYDKRDEVLPEHRLEWEGWGEHWRIHLHFDALTRWGGWTDEEDETVSPENQPL